MRLMLAYGYEGVLWEGWERWAAEPKAVRQ